MIFLNHISSEQHPLAYIEESLGVFLVFFLFKKNHNELVLSILTGSK